MPGNDGVAEKNTFSPHPVFGEASGRMESGEEGKPDSIESSFEANPFVSSKNRT
jgi:hypothetical protein